MDKWVTFIFVLNEFVNLSQMQKCKNNQMAAKKQKKTKKV